MSYSFRKFGFWILMPILVLIILIYFSTREHLSRKYDVDETSYFDEAKDIK